MPKWWPWARSERPAMPTEPSAPVAADRPPAAWRRLAPIQRTVGDIEPTAQFAGFAETLTTSANPAFTRPMALLTAEGLDGLPVLDTVRESVRADAPAPSSAPASRRWAPRLPSVQRSRVGVSAPVQRRTEGGAPEAQVFPAEPTDHTESTSAREMVEASDVDERRPLDAVPTDTVPTDAVAAIAADSPTDAPPSIGAAPAPPTTDTVEPVTVGQPGPPRAPTVQRTAIGAAPSTTLPVVQTVSTSPTPPRQTAAPALRHIATVQRMAGTGPLPTLRIVDAAAPPSPPHDADTSAPEMSMPESVALSPREPDTPDVETLPAPAPAQDPIAPITSTPPAPTPTSPPSSPHHDVPVQRAAPQSEPLLADAGVHADTRTDFPQAVPALPVVPSVASPAVPSSPTPANPTPSIPVPSAQRVHLSSPGSPPPRAVIPVQRIDAAAPTNSPSPIAPSFETHGPAAQPARALTFELDRDTAPDAGMTDAAATDTIVSGTNAAPGTAAAGHPDVHTAFAPAPAERHRTATAPTEPVITQRITPPVAETAAIARPATPIHPVVQRAAQNRRLVVLPPIRTDSEPPSNTVGTATTESTAVGSSPRPVGLQRMFAAAGSTTTPRAEIPSQPTPTESPISAHYFAAPDRFDREPAHHYDTATNTITFDTAHVQREPDESTPAPPPEAAPEPATEPAGPGVTAVAPVAAAAAPPPAGTNIDELLNKLYDPLVARLRAELWLDRERSGMLMDLNQ